MELLEKMELVDPKYLIAVEKAPRRKRRPAINWKIAAACLCLGAVLTVPALAAAVPAWYDALYAVSPATAQLFQPVQLACEDKGIRMEVVAVHLRENRVEIYLSLQDLEQERLDETIDLFDSYGIRTPFDCTGHCRQVSFDPETQTATFLITLTQWGEQDIRGDKLTVTLGQLLCGKENWEGVVPGVDWIEGVEAPAVQLVSPRGWSGEITLQEAGGEEKAAALQPGPPMASPTEGVTVTGIGYVEDILHVQVYYEAVLETDNHGSISLYQRAKGEQIPCAGSLAFFDEDRSGSYEDYLFPGISAEELEEYELYGTFVTTETVISGDWKVTIPLTEREKTVG